MGLWIKCCVLCKAQFMLSTRCAELIPSPRFNDDTTDMRMCECFPTEFRRRIAIIDRVVMNKLTTALSNY
jgi:hypothetical protein